MNTLRAGCTSVFVVSTLLLGSCADFFEPRSSGVLVEDGESSIRVADWGALSPPPGMLLQSAYCWYILDDSSAWGAELRVMGMDLGTRATVRTMDQYWGYDLRNLAYDGERFALGYPNSEGGAVFWVLDMVDGGTIPSEELLYSHHTVFWAGDHWRSNARHPASGAADASIGTIRYDGVLELLTGNGVDVNGYEDASVLQGRDGEVFGVSMDGPEVLRYTLDDPEPYDRIPLGGFDGQIAGMARAGGEWFVMDRGDQDATGERRAFLYRFAADGSLIARFPAAGTDVRPSGPWCESLLSP